MQISPQRHWYIKMSKRVMTRVKTRGNIQGTMIMTKWPLLTTSEIKLIAKRVSMATVKVRRKSKRSP